jgi:hypothetical protein
MYIFLIPQEIELLLLLLFINMSVRISLYVSQLILQVLKLIITI